VGLRAATATAASLLACAATVTLALAAGPTEGESLSDGEDGGCTPALGNSLEGRPILTMDGMKPGDRARNAVRISNRGCEPLLLSLEAALRERPGPLGGLLSNGLHLSVRRVPLEPATPGPQPGRKMYSDWISGFQRLELGIIRPGAARRYRFAVRMPLLVGEDGESQNAFQGSRLDATVRWRVGPPAAAIAGAGG
jgi:hypothetical protein